MGRKDWVPTLHLEVARLVAPHGSRVMTWLGKAEQLDIAPASALEDSEEFPRLDVLLAEELFKKADSGCQELSTRTKSLRGARLTNRTVAKGRVLLLFYIRCFHAQCKCRHHIPMGGCRTGSLRERQAQSTCCKTGPSSCPLNKQPPADFVCATFLKQVKVEL